MFDLQRKQHPKWTCPADADFSQLPDGIEESSWRHDTMPSWTWPDAGLKLYIDYPRPSVAAEGERVSEAGEEGFRFVVQALNEHEQYLSDLLWTDACSEVVALISQRCTRH